MIKNQYNLNGYNFFGGFDRELSSMKNILQYYGVTAPHTGEPFTEEMLLGISGGLGAGYFVIAYPNTQPGGILGFRNNWETDGIIPKTICERIGAQYRIYETASQKRAVNNLTNELENDNPVIAYCDLASLPYSFLREKYIKSFKHNVVIFGYDEGENSVKIGDKSNSLFEIETEQIKKARSAITSFKNRLISISPPEKIKDLAIAYRNGIIEGVTKLLDPPRVNFGLKGFAKWANLLTNNKNKAGWPNVFENESYLIWILAWFYSCIELNGSKGAYRNSYAMFLDDASDILKIPKLKKNIEDYREIAYEWSLIADSLLPSNHKITKELKALLNKKYEMFVVGKLDQVEKLERSYRKTEQQAIDNFPFNKTEISNLYINLEKKIELVYEKELKITKHLRKLII